MDVKKNTLTRHTFRKLLFQEFGIEIGEGLKSLLAEKGTYE